MIQAPLDLRTVSFRFTPGTIRVPPPVIASPAAAPARTEGTFAGLIDKHGLTPVVLGGMLGLATLFGAAHALAPGHGKTVMAAYLVGTQGRPRDAVLLGVVVSTMHTASVLVLGVVLFHLSRNTAVDRIYPVLKVISGVLVAGLGLWMLRGRLGTLRRNRRPSDLHHEHGDEHAHDHSHHHHDHDHDDATHGHGHGHTHELSEGTAPLSRRGLAVLATAGGLFPSPSALVVLVSAFTLGRAALGLALVGAFSVGLAATLTAVGLLLVYGKGVAARRETLRRAIRIFPVAGASAIAAIGTALVVQGASAIH
jgi:ABC-type nickel/cobalt efflux system permease component RcnA